MISKLLCGRKFSGEQIKTWNGVSSMSGNYRSDSLRCQPLEIFVLRILNFRGPTISR